MLILSLLALSASTLAAPYTPPPTHHPTCGSTSTNVSSWNVHDFDFHASYVFSTPAHQNSWGYVNFTLENPAVAYKAVCSASSDQLNDFFYGTATYKCVLPDEKGSSSDRSTFTFSRPNGALHIDQAWSCVDEGTRYKAAGGLELNLECKDETWENDDWHAGEIYSIRTVTCDKLDASVPMDTITVVG